MMLDPPSKKDFSTFILWCTVPYDTTTNNILKTNLHLKGCFVDEKMTGLGVDIIEMFIRGSEKQ